MDPEPGEGCSNREEGDQQEQCDPSMTPMQRLARERADGLWQRPVRSNGRRRSDRTPVRYRTLVMRA